MHYKKLRFKEESIIESRIMFSVNSSVNYFLDINYHKISINKNMYFSIFFNDFAKLSYN